MTSQKPWIRSRAPQPVGQNTQAPSQLSDRWTTIHDKLWHFYSHWTEMHSCTFSMLLNTLYSKSILLWTSQNYLWQVTSLHSLLYALFVVCCLCCLSSVTQYFCTKCCIIVLNVACLKCLSIYLTVNVASMNPWWTVYTMYCMWLKWKTQLTWLLKWLELTCRLLRCWVRRFIMFCTHS